MASGTCPLGRGDCGITPNIIWFTEASLSSVLRLETYDDAEGPATPSSPNSSAGTGRQP
jgi:hypothetical protein